MGFDITRRSGAPGETLVSGHNLLRTLLPEIAHYVTSKPGLCCVDPLRIRTSIGYRVVSQDGRTLYDTSFEGYSDDVVRKVSTFNLPQPTYFNTALLKSLGEKLKASGAGVKVSLRRSTKTNLSSVEDTLWYCFPSAWREEMMSGFSSVSEL